MNNPEKKEAAAADSDASSARVSKKLLSFAIVGLVLVSIVVGVVFFALSENLPLSVIAGLVFGLMLLNLAFVYLSPGGQDSGSPDKDLEGRS